MKVYKYNREYQKTILKSYLPICNCIGALEKEINKQAIKSHRDIMDPLTQCNNIINLLTIKDELISINKTIESMLSKLSTYDYDVIAEQYFNAKPKAKCEYSELTLTIYRRRALGRFSRILTVNGIGKEWFQESLLKFPFIRKLYNEELSKSKKES